MEDCARRNHAFGKAGELTSGLAEALGADDVFAVEALAHFAVGRAGDAAVAADGLQAAAFLRDVEDVAAFAPCWWNLGREVGLLGEERCRLHLCTIAVVWAYGFHSLVLQCRFPQFIRMKRSAGIRIQVKYKELSWNIVSLANRD